MAREQQEMTNGADQPGIGPLLRGIVNDVQDLVGQQVNLLKAELTSDIRKTREAVAVFGAGVTVCFVGGVLLCFMLVHLLNWLTVPKVDAETGLPLWACFGIVGGVITAIGGALVYMGKQKFASFNPLPDQTATAIKETLEWKTTTPK